jgi:UDP-N-acetylmuramate-alanine ligase
MAAEVLNLPSQKLHVVGIMGTAMIPIAEYVLLDVSKKDEVIHTILTELANNNTCIFGNSLIKTEGFDGFRVL